MVRKLPFYDALTRYGVVKVNLTLALDGYITSLLIQLIEHAVYSSLLRTL